ncbi:MAG: D-2-hydroxyacid dehydrogenase family protein [Alphaproteobacteria bacterium]|nr:D-2-hydroxyacid dehydrogenase family protein [Alphaproteobacteria bacterium]
MSGTTKVAILDDYQGVALQFADWKSLPPSVEVAVFRDTITDQAALAARLAPFQVICAMRERTPFRRALIEKLPNLKLLVTSGMRNASLDMAALKERCIAVCGTESLHHPTAELTWGLILAFLRRIPEDEANLRAGRWQRTMGEGLKSRTLGVIGLGKLGAQVAKVGLAFGMEVVAWSQNLTDARCAEIGVRRVGKEELLRSADVISIHLVLSDRSRGLVGAAELAQMKPTALLVNTSRAPIVDQAALVAALTERRIGGAALDVFEEEPLPAGHPILSCPNTVLTPHLGYVIAENYARFYGEMVDNIKGWLAGAPKRVIG